MVPLASSGDIRCPRRMDPRTSDLITWRAGAWFVLVRRYRSSSPIVNDLHNNVRDRHRAIASVTRWPRSKDVSSLNLSREIRGQRHPQSCPMGACILRRGSPPVRARRAHPHGSPANETVDNLGTWALSSTFVGNYASRQFAARLGLPLRPRERLTKHVRGSGPNPPEAVALSG